METAKSEKKMLGASIEKLMETIPFTEMDLEVNGRFKVSRTQKERLKPKVDLYFILTIIATFVLSVFTLVVAYADLRESALFVIKVFLGVATFAAVICLILSFRIKLQWISREGVKTVVGNSNLEIFYSGENNDIPNYRITINGVSFRLTEQLYDAFPNGKLRVYYFRILHNELLSVEIVK